MTVTSLLQLASSNGHSPSYKRANATANANTGDDEALVTRVARVVRKRLFAVGFLLAVGRDNSSKTLDIASAVLCFLQVPVRLLSACGCKTSGNGLLQGRI